MTVATAPTPTAFRLRAVDRCDRCPAQARLEATSPTTGTALLFCAHHASKFETKLVADGFTIHDERASLHAKAGE